MINYVKRSMPSSGPDQKPHNSDIFPATPVPSMVSFTLLTSPSAALFRPSPVPIQCWAVVTWTSFSSSGLTWILMPLVSPVDVGQTSCLKLVWVLLRTLRRSSFLSSPSSRFHPLLVVQQCPLNLPPPFLGSQSPQARMSVSYHILDLPSVPLSVLCFWGRLRFFQDSQSDESLTFSLSTPQSPASASLSLTLPTPNFR